MFAENVFIQPEELWSAYLDCRKRKRHTEGFAKFESNFPLNFENLLESLNNNTYSPTTSTCFVVNKPKPREVFAADFGDRIVHHLIYNRLNPYFERIFIYDSYACRKNKGNLRAVDRVQHFMRSISNNGKEKAYYLQCDIKSFFMSIDKNILWGILNKQLPKALKYESHEFIEKFRNLLRINLFHNPTKNYINKSSFKKWKCVPEDKTLFNSNDFKGIPIGNLTSQFFANVYLNELDKFVKHTLKVKYYIRYVDDFIMMSKDKNELWKLFRMIEEFLNEKLHLKMKKHPKLALLSSGINFVGYVQHIHYRLVRRRVANNFKERLKDFEYDSEDNLIKLRESINSYFSYFITANGHRELLKIFRNNLWLSEYFMVGKKKVWIY